MFKLGQLVENWSMGFGRVIEILSNGWVGVKFSYLPADNNIRYFAPDTKALTVIPE